MWKTFSLKAAVSVAVILTLLSLGLWLSVKFNVIPVPENTKEELELEAVEANGLWLVATVTQSATVLSMLKH